MAMATKKEIIFYICIFVQFLSWISVFFYSDRDFTGKQWIPLNALFAGLHYPPKVCANFNFLVILRRRGFLIFKENFL
jgi:hypothetical protein